MKHITRVRKSIQKNKEQRNLYNEEFDPGSG